MDADSQRASWEKYIVLFQVITNMDVKERRRVFQSVRTNGQSPDIFFPALGFTLAEFSVFYILCSDRRTSRSTRKSVLRKEGGRSGPSVAHGDAENVLSF
ncbi:MAG: hypothetical protein CMM02_08070 [Rhodopirellula sp.]|nr:hypothetical protein [Rhodopirellula sp.]MAT10950.1 hypothetical protein [Rhodopirellula sp.]